MLKQLRNIALVGACLVAFAAPAAACNPPPGLDVYRYEAICRQTLHRLYPQYGAGLPYPNYVMAWYQVYLRAQNPQPGVTTQGILDHNQRLRDTYTRHNEEWSRRFRGS
jgi:hypothetical protein